MADLPALPAGNCNSISGDNSFSITIRIYYTYKVTTTITTSQNGCCGNAAPADHVNPITSAVSASDFTHTIPFIAQVFQFGKIYNPAPGALVAYKNHWETFSQALEEKRSSLEKPEKVISTSKSAPQVCVAGGCINGKRQSAITCVVTTTTKSKTEAESVVVNRTITSSDAVCSFT